MKSTYSRATEWLLILSSSFEQDTILAELLQINKEYIVGYHEHDSLLDHKEEEELTEEERKAAWAEYEAEKKVKLSNHIYIYENNLSRFKYHSPSHFFWEINFVIGQEIDI